MRRTVLLISVLLIAFGAITAHCLHARQTKPTEVNWSNPYFVEPPASLADMQNECDAVVYGQITAGVSKDVGFYHKSDRGITTYYRFRVIKVLRSRPDIDPEEITIVHDGGFIDRGSKIEKLEIQDFPQFEVGREYVLFLRWVDEHGAWTPKWGPHGTFEVQRGRIRSWGSARISKKQDDLTIGDFFAKLTR